MKPAPIIAIALLVAGCAAGPAEDEIALKISYIRVYESRDAGISDPTYLGSVHLPHCVVNPKFPAPRGYTAQYLFTGAVGWEVYQVEPTNSLKLLDNSTENVQFQEGLSNFSNVFASHAVFANETASGGTHYALHLWSEIIRPEPTGHEDHWLNVTFIPNGSGTLATEGTDATCGGASSI